MDSNEFIWSCAVLLEESKRIIIDTIDFKKNVIRMIKMFEFNDCVKLKVEDYYVNGKTITIPVNITMNEEKIEDEIDELTEALCNLRKLFGKDYVLVVTKDRVRIMSEE